MAAERCDFDSDEEFFEAQNHDLFGSYHEQQMMEREQEDDQYYPDPKGMD